MKFLLGFPYIRVLKGDENSLMEVSGEHFFIQNHPNFP